MNLLDLITSQDPENLRVWDVSSVHELLESQGIEQSPRSTARQLEKCEWLPSSVEIDGLKDELSRDLKVNVRTALDSKAKKKRHARYIVQSRAVNSKLSVLVVNDERDTRRWTFEQKSNIDAMTLPALLDRFCDSKPVLWWPHEELTAIFRVVAQNNGSNHLELPSGVKTLVGLPAYQSVLQFDEYPYAPRQKGASDADLTHIDRLEAESIHIMREVVAQAENPVMLYSVGKDSSVMLHLARKAFYPSPPPFPLMHVDTRWKFQAMYDFRDQMAKAIGMDLIVHINPEGVQKNINPIDHGSALHTDIMKTQGLKQALDEHKFDVAFGGARRDEEKSRAKERVFSFRSSTHRWDPKSQRPELWNIYNGYKSPGEGIRVFPLSNWTELDIWQYIHRENIPIVPLYYAAEQPVVERDGMLLMVDDDRLSLMPGEEIELRKVRFRTLGCYPLTGAFESEADDLSGIVLELLQSHTSEREGRAIDSDASASMEKKKQEGYF